LNFGNGQIADGVAQMFNKQRYKVLGQFIKSSAATREISRGHHGFSYNAVPWSVILSDLSSRTNPKDISVAIALPRHNPRHIEMGAMSYGASDLDVSTHVRSRLEEHGLLESFFLAPDSKGRRVKATALFYDEPDEPDAKSAFSLNNQSLGILNNGKLTITLVQSARTKVSTIIYFALQSPIMKESKT